MPTKQQWAAFLAAWSGWVLDAFDFTIFLLVMHEMTREFGVTLTAGAGSITLTLLVRLLGGAVAGWAADRWGRKLPLMIAVIWFAVCDAAIAFAPSFTWVLILRTLFGFGMGAEWTAGATLAMESWPEKTRGLASGVLQGSWAVGYLLAAAASAWIVPRWGWRPLFLLAALPALMVLPIRFLVEESPEWKPAPRARIDLRALIRGTIIMALGFGVYYALSGVYPAMLAARGLDASQIGTVLVLFNLGMLIGSIACGVLAQRRGPLIAIAVPALAMLPLLPLYVGAVPGALHLGAFLGGAIGVGFCGTVPAMLTGLFPAAVRGRAVGVVYHAGAFAAAFVPLAVSALAEHTRLGLPGAIALVAGVLELALAGMFVAAPIIERSTLWRSSHGSSSA